MKTNAIAEGQSLTIILSKWAGFICLPLIMLFIYTASGKLMDFDHFRLQMAGQPLPLWLAHLLTYSLPELEIMIALLMALPVTRLYGLYVAFVLMLLFTGYVGLMLINYFGRVPCSCGGVLRSMGWKTHFVFNIFFLLLSAIGIYLTNRERRGVGKKD